MGKFQQIRKWLRNFHIRGILPVSTYFPTIHQAKKRFEKLIINFLVKQMFKLEDVAMGIWIADLKKNGLEVKYKQEERVYNEGCKDGYVVAHYQGPREMLCLWQKLQEDNRAFCCGN